MKNLYYEVFDNTREYKDPNHSSFWYQPVCNDFAGVVTAFAKHNGVSPDNVRLFFYETKARWEEAEREWRNKVDWNIPLLP